MTERLHFHFSLSCIGEGNGKPLQCSCLENPRDGGAWWAAIYGVAQIWTRLKRLSSSSQCRRCQRQGFDPWVGKILWRRKWQLIPVFLPGESCGQRSLVGYSPWVAKSRTQLSMSMSCVSFYCKSKMNQPHVCLYPLPFLPLRSAQCVKR